MFSKTSGAAFALTATLVLALAVGSAFAHVTKSAGDGDYQLTVGFVGAPLYVGQIEQVELTAVDAAGEPVVGLESSLLADILGPGDAVLELTLRTVHGAPGRYLADFMPTVVGNYDVRLHGFVGAFEFDEVFSGVEMAHSDPVVGDPAAISVP